MKRLTLILLSFIIVLGMSAQGVLRQKGYVRTVGRPDAPKGKPLSGVLIGVQGQTNNVRSRQDGHFEIPFAQASAGVSSFRLSRVTLGGYNLYETSIMGRPLPVSPSFPLEIVMVSAKEVEAMKQKFTEQVRQRYQTELNKLRAAKAQLGERYQAELNRVNEKYKNCDAYVADLVERFSHIDYATLDYQSSCVYASIEAGNLDEADRLLNQTNSAELLKARAAITKHIEQEQASVRNIDRRLSDYYNGKFEVHAARFDNDSAAWYMQQLVALDTTNVKNLMKAAGFYHNSCSKYPESLAYYQRALRQLEAAHEEHSLDAALCYREMSSSFFNMQRNAEAMQVIQKAMQIYGEVEGEDTEHMAMCYLLMSLACERTNDTTKVVDYMQKSIDLRTRLFGPHYVQLGNNYNNLALFYQQHGQYAKARDCYEKGVTLLDSTDCKAADILGTLYSNWGGMLFDQKRYEEALRLFQKAEGYQRKNTGDGLNFYCMTLHSIGNAYRALGYQERGEYYARQAIDLLVKRYGEYGVPLRDYYKEQADQLRLNRDFESALSLYRKVQNIDEANAMGKGTVSLAGLKESMAVCFFNTGRYDDALSAYSEAIGHMQESGQMTHQQECFLTTRKAYCLFKLGRLHEAMDMAKEAERIREANKLETGSEVEVMYRCYCALIKAEGDKWCKPFKKFMADKMFTIDIPKSLLDIPGEDTEFVLVSYSAWDWDAERDIFERTDEDFYKYDQRSMTIVLPSHKKAVYMDFDINPKCTIHMVTGVNKLARKLMCRTLSESAVKYWPENFK